MWVAGNKKKKRNIAASNDDEDLTTQTEARRQGLVSLEDFLLPWIVPASSIGNGSGYGADWGYVGVGTSFISRTTPRGKRADGAVSLTGGFGDARKVVGFELNLAMLRLDHLFSVVLLNLKIHKTFESGLGMAFGLDNFARIGKTFGGNTVTLSLSKAIPLKRGRGNSWFSMIVLHGGGKITQENPSQDNLAIHTTPFVFATFALRVRDPLMCIVEWDGSALHAGISIAPFRTFPLVLSFSGVKLYPDRQDSAFLLTFGYGDSVRSDNFPLNAAGGIRAGF